MTILPIPPLAKWQRWVPGQSVLVAWAVLAALFGWTYWTALDRVVRAWWSTPDYGHGFVVPAFAAFLLWLRQDMVDPWPTKGSWWAMAFFAVWAFLRWGIAYFGYERDIDSLYFFLAGVALFLGGWKALHWAWPSIVFLAFMVPLPNPVADMFSQFLQMRIATPGSVFTLQTLGIAAIAEGNQIYLSQAEHPLDVAGVCSGLRMLMLFFAVCVGAAFVVRAAWWEKMVLVVSAVPIALVSNIFRISVTGILTELFSHEVGEFFHEYLGVTMMVLAILLLWGEIALISNLVPETTVKGPLTLGGRRPSPPLGPPPGPAPGAGPGQRPGAGPERPDGGLRDRPRRRIRR
jgi:exosortase